MGQTRPLLFIFAALQCKVKYNTNLTLIDQSIDVVHGIRSQGSRMEGADESTELRRHPCDVSTMFTAHIVFFLSYSPCV